MPALEKWIALSEKIIQDIYLNGTLTTVTHNLIKNADKSIMSLQSMYMDLLKSGQEASNYLFQNLPYKYATISRTIEKASEIKYAQSVNSGFKKFDLNGKSICKSNAIQENLENSDHLNSIYGKGLSYLNMVTSENSDAIECERNKQNIESELADLLSTPVDKKSKTKKRRYPFFDYEKLEECIVDKQKLEQCKLLAGQWLGDSSYSAIRAILRLPSNFEANECFT